MVKIAYIFPGQGSQRIGMGKNLSLAFKKGAEIFDEASDVLDFDMRTLCWEGPVDRLNQTEFTQPALLTVSIATLAILKEEGIEPFVVAGHSLGEYSALVSAQAMPFAMALALVRNRGRYMQEAVAPGKGAMSAILGLSKDEVARVCDKAVELGIVSLANLNSPVQTVIAGEKKAVDYACELARDAGAKRTIPLPVSVPSHCALMVPAAKRLAEDLSGLPVQDPAIPVVTNVDAQVVTKADEVRDGLIRQLAAPVRWVDSILEMREIGADHFVEVGPGKVLTGLLKRTVKDVMSFQVGEPDELILTVKALKP